ncbi:WD repeat-containing protein 43 U3 small nucleolar RNA-associated protein 5 -like protein [Collichthys lucidus]|uniref:WD repeat-containing protein 43 U3 small nucleolar RNA-associated protein 5-like protein n=2 Tax=Collichthys lucidus TaxID=240159 RepID=A0A4U5VDP2_COLLU|nr:WD repeat-containing protein 43 U3 small nucleolar RNA-associated protein 5 -like protein [Collichthys lucidus]
MRWDATRGSCKPRTQTLSSASEMAADGGSSPLQLPCVFSPKSRQYLALCAQDGRLRVWNTDSKTLHQEYVPSAHLSATCVCIAWGPCRTVKEGPQRKKRKSEAVQVEEKADLLAMGTAAGTVLIYSTAKGALHCTLDGGHSAGVNCVQWHPEDSLLYSGSDDTNIVEWDLQTGKTRSKWKADRASVTSLCVSPDGKLLLSAGQIIKMWDLETKEVYRKFTGHSTAVTTLCFATTRPPDSNGLYFLSGAAHDRLLSVWQVREDRKDKNSVVSFTLTDEPQHVDLVTSNSKEEAMRLAVVCKDGQLHLFEHFLNGPCKKPMSPSCTVQMSDTKDSPVPIPLLAAALRADTRTVQLAYGNHLQPVMEKVEINTAERHVCLTRDVQTSLSLSIETAVSKVKTPIVNAKSKVLVPGLPGHQAPIKGISQGSEKRKKDTDTKEVSIAERLGEIDLSSVSAEKGAPKGTASLQTDNFAVLLVQGLESRDANILNKVFQTRKDMVIKKTVARLPLPAVLPLVQELTNRLQGHPFTAVLMVRWLKAVLMHHTSYLASLPDLVTQLGVLYHMIESRVKMFHKLTKLHGKLYLLMTQVATNDSTNTVTDVDHTAKLVYEEESSDEDEASGDEGLPDNDSDNWEEEAMEDNKEEQVDEEDDDPDSRTDSKANGEEDMEHGNESEEE